MATIFVKTNEATAARRRVYFQCVDVTDGITPETGEAGGQPQKSVDGAAFADAGIGTLTHIGNGRYYADLTQAIVNAADIVICTRYKSANTAECVGDTVQVLSHLDAIATIHAVDFPDIIDATDALAATLVLMPGATADAVWDEVLTAATHNVATSAGRRLRQIAGAVISNDALPAQAGIAINQVKLAAGEPATDHIYEQAIVTITSGTGVGQSRLVVNYLGGTKVCTLNRNWDTAPVAADEYTVTAFSGFLFTNQGIALAATASTIDLATTAAAVDGAYIGSIVHITTGTGAGQSRLVTAYTTANKRCTVSPNWTTTPDVTSAYVIIPVGRAIVDSVSAAAATAIGDSVLDHTLTTHATADTVGIAMNHILDMLAWGFPKNAIYNNFMFQMFLASDHATPATGVAVTATRSIDGAAFAACANAVTEISNGWYKINLAAADLNGNLIALRFTAALCDDAGFTLKTTS